jgi:hypothetical protein
LNDLEQVALGRKRRDSGCDASFPVTDTPKVVKSELSSSSQ